MSTPPMSRSRLLSGFSPGSRRLAIAALTCTLCAGVIGVASAAPKGDAIRAVRRANDKIEKQLRVQVEAGSDAETALASRVTESVREFLDVEELGRLAMVDHWAELPGAQQKEFLELLRTLVEANYVKGLRANLEYRVEYTGEQATGDNTTVSTTIETRRRGRPMTITIDYVVRNEDGRWRAFDVVTDGVGLVENYRAQFNRIIAKEGVDGLLERMRKKRTAMQ